MRPFCLFIVVFCAIQFSHAQSDCRLKRLTTYRLQSAYVSATPTIDSISKTVYELAYAEGKLSGITVISWNSDGEFAPTAHWRLAYWADSMLLMGQDTISFRYNAKRLINSRKYRQNGDACAYFYDAQNRLDSIFCAENDWSKYYYRGKQEIAMKSMHGAILSKHIYLFDGKSNPLYGDMALYRIAYLPAVSSITEIGNILVAYEMYANGLTRKHTYTYSYNPQGYPTRCVSPYQILDYEYDCR